MKTISRQRAMGVAVILGLAMGLNSFGVDREWAGATSEIQGFAIPDNWAPSGIPVSGDKAIFTGDDTNGNGIGNGSNFTVQLTTSPTIDNLLVRAGQFAVTLDMNGQTLTTTGNPLIEGSGTGVVLNVSGGGTAAWKEFHIGTTAGTTGTLNINGTALNTTSATSTHLVGSSGTGFFHMSGGAVFAHTGGRTISVGGNASGNGTWTLTGTNTAMTSLGHIWIGDRGSASLVIQNGASVSMTGGGNAVYIGQRGGSGQVVTALITGENSLLNSSTTGANRGISIGGGDRGGTNWSSGSTHMTVANQGRIHSNRLILLSGTAKLTIDNGTATAGTDLEALSGAEFEFILHNANRDALIQAVGNVNLATNVTLELALGTGASFNVGQFVELIQYDGSLGGTAGVFANYAEDDEFTLGAYDFRFTYAGGAGNKKIGLEVIPEPHTILLLTLGAAALWVRRRRS